VSHRGFLPIKHLVRNKGNPFKEEANHYSKPMHCNGKHVFGMIKDLKVVFGKGPGSQLNPSENGKRDPSGRSLYFGTYHIVNSYRYVTQLT